MRDNLIFSGINLPPQNTPDDPEMSLKHFMQDSLKLSAAAVKEITFHRVHRLPSKNPNKPPPINSNTSSKNNLFKAEGNN